MFNESPETCSVCGGDGQIGNSFGAQKTCPICRGSGRRTEDSGHWDVTKTKPSHHRRPAEDRAPQQARERRKDPLTSLGIRLAEEVKASAVPDDVKTKLVRDIVDYEASHGTCTKTFSKKIRKQIRPPA